MSDGMKVLQDIETVSHMWAYCIGWTAGVILEAASWAVEGVIAEVAHKGLELLAGDYHDE